MFNKSNKGESMEDIILIVRNRRYSDGTKSFYIEKSAPTMETALEYLVALDTLNTDKEVSYHLCKEFING